MQLLTCIKIVISCWADGFIMMQSVQMIIYCVSMNIYIHVKCVNILIDGA